MLTDLETKQGRTAGARIANAMKELVPEQRAEIFRILQAAFCWSCGADSSVCRCFAEVDEVAPGPRASSPWQRGAR